MLLFTPPFDHSQPHPGYIMGYPPGLRENGGQYTHGSLWLALAWARLGDGDAAVRLLQMMNPVEAQPHSGGSRALSRRTLRRSPPMFLTAPGQGGQAGWTWYTGSAAWMYRIWIEEVLGFQLRGDTVTISPAIPGDWEDFEIKYRYRSTLYEFSIRRETGTVETGSPIQLVDDGKPHKIELHLRESGATRLSRAGDLLLTRV